jgi:membrane protease YdiL (CAAX protease family)
MTGQVTSPGLARWTPAEWRDFAAFLRRPVLPQRVTGIRLAAVGATLRLFALDLLVMALLIGTASLASKLGYHLPENAIDKLKLGPGWLLLIIVVLPIGEELTFRAWLSGRPGHVTAIAVLAAAGALAFLSSPQAYPILAAGSLVIGIVLAAGLLFWLRHHPPFPFFSRHFRWFYFVGALLFAAAHLGNYDGAALVLLPLVIPQLLVGLILGYTRVTYGLWSDILLHMMHNGLLIGLVVLEKGMAG